MARVFNESRLDARNTEEFIWQDSEKREIMVDKIELIIFYKMIIFYKKHLSEMEDSQFEISEEDKSLTKKFYRK